MSLEKKIKKLEDITTSAGQSCTSANILKSRSSLLPAINKEEKNMWSEEIPTENSSKSRDQEQTVINILETRADSGSSSSKVSSCTLLLRSYASESESPDSNSEETDEDDSSDLSQDGFWSHVQEIPTTKVATNSDPLLSAADEDSPIADACSPPPQCRHQWSEWPAPAIIATDAAGASSPAPASDAELIALLASCAGTSSCTAPACQRTHDHPGQADAADAPWDFILGL